MSPRTQKTIQVTFSAVAAVALVFFALFFGLRNTVKASATDNVSGYASNVQIGSISFNCTNDASCGTNDYGVTVQEPYNFKASLTGKAWNDQVGWISFDSVDLSGGSAFCGVATCPQGQLELGGAGGTFFYNGRVQGWARILSMTGATGGGFIQLSDNTSQSVFPSPGFNGDLGVTYDDANNTLIGWAWSADIGWINFAGVSVTPPDPFLNISSMTFKVNDIYDLGTTAASPNPALVPIQYVTGGQLKFEWSTHRASNCVAVSSNNDPLWSGPMPDTSPAGGYLFIPSLYNLTSPFSTYKLECTTTSGGTVTMKPGFTMQVVPQYSGGYIGVEQQGLGRFSTKPLKITWYVVGPNNTMHDCDAITTGGLITNIQWTGTNTLPNGTSIIGGTPGSPQQITVVPTPVPIGSGPYTFKINCRNISGGNSGSWSSDTFYSGTVPPGVNVTLASNNTAVQAGEDIVLSYFDSGVIGSCTVSQDPPEPGAGTATGWEGTVPTPNLNVAQSTLVHMGNQTTTFYINCNTASGPIQRSVTVTILPPSSGATATLTAFPQTGLSPNGQTTLTYSTNNVSSCTTTTTSAPGGTSTYAGWTGRAEVSTHLNQTDVDTSTGGSGTYDGGAQVSIDITDTTYTLNCFELDGTTPVAPASVTVSIARSLTLSFDPSVFTDTMNVSTASPNVQLSWWSNATLAGANCQTFSSPTSWWETYAVASSQVAPTTSTSNAISGTTTFWMTCYDAGLNPVTSNTVIANWTSMVAPIVTLAGAVCLDPDDGGNGYPGLSLNIFDPSGLIGVCTLIDNNGISHTWNTVMGAFTGGPIFLTFPNSFTFTASCTVSAGSPPTIAPLDVGFNGQASWCAPGSGDTHKGGLEYEEH